MLHILLLLTTQLSYLAYQLYSTELDANQKYATEIYGKEPEVKELEDTEEQVIQNTIR